MVADLTCRFVHIASKNIHMNIKSILIEIDGRTLAMQPFAYLLYGTYAQRKLQHNVPYIPVYHLT